MASFNGSSSLSMACDEYREYECGPCLLGGRTREAKHYCIDCPDYLCDGCKDHHCTLAVTRDHTIMSGSRIPVSARGRPSLGIICSCNNSIAMTIKISSAALAKRSIITNAKPLASRKKVRATNHQSLLRYWLK